MADIVAANVTATKDFEFTQSVVPNEIKTGPGPRWKILFLTITIATNTDYDTTTEIPLDNLFDSTHASYIGLVKATCRTVGTEMYLASTNAYEVAAWDWANMKLRIKAVATAAEIADGTAIGTGSIKVVVLGREVS